jgi:LPS export ABC transporter protein LptC
VTFGLPKGGMINNTILKKHLLRAAMVYSCFFLLSCENDEREINEWMDKKVMVEEAKGITSLFSQGGTLRAKLTSPLMLRYLGDTVYIEFPNTLHVDFYDSTITRESWVDARYGKYFENLNKVLLRDSVQVINIKGDTLKTPELWWDQNLKIFFTDSSVRITTKDKRIYGGKGLEAAQDMSWYVIKQPTGTIRVSNESMSNEPPPAMPLPPDQQ